MNITENISLIETTKENLRVELGLGLEVPFSDYVKSIDPNAPESPAFNSDTSGYLLSMHNTKEQLRVSLSIPKTVPFSRYIEYIGREEIATPDLFAGGKMGLWYDFSDLSTLYQDVDGLVPVTSDGQPVQKIMDKSGNGLHAIVYNTPAYNSPKYRTDGVIHWLEVIALEGLIVLGFDSRIIPQPLTVVNTFERLSYDFRGYLWDGRGINNEAMSGRFIEGLDKMSIFNSETGTGSTRVTSPAVGSPDTSIVHMNHLNSTSELNNGVVENFETGTTYIESLSLYQDVYADNTAPIRVFSTIIVEGEIQDKLNLKKYLARKSGVTL